MSKHIIAVPTATGRDCHVEMGWDRALQQVFLLVHDGDPMDGCIFDSIAEPLSSSEEIAEKLSELGIHLPPTLKEQVDIDMACNEGNRLVEYSAQGDILSEHKF